MKKFLLSVAAVAMAMTAAADVYVIGNCTDPDWNIDDAPMCDQDGDVYTYEFDDVTAPMFRFYTALGDWDNGSIGYQVADESTEFEVPEGNVFEGPAVDGKGNWSFPNFKGALTAELNLNAMTVKFTFEPSDDEPEVGFGVHGNFATGEWATTDMVEGSTGKWSCVFEDLAEATGEFGVKKTLDGNQTAWYALPKTAEGAEAPAAVTGATQMTLADADTENIAVNGLTGTYTFFFDPETLVLEIVEGNVGIASIAADVNATAVYYNLNGVRVANPENGLFIMVKGGVASKIVK